MVNADSTVEQVEAYMAALDVEKESYQARFPRVGSLHERLSEEELKDRIAQVAAEKKRAGGLLSAAKKRDKKQAE
jgi:hypothetical protein